MKSHKLIARGLMGPFCFMIISIMACSGVNKETKTPFFDKWRAKAEEFRGFSPPASKPIIGEHKKAIDQMERHSEIEKDPEPSLSNAKVTLDMYDTEIDVVLRTLAKAINQSIMINESVKGTINVNATNEPWDRVFLGVLCTSGLTYDWVGNIIRIKTLGDMNLDQKLKETLLQEKQLQLKLENTIPFCNKIIKIKYADAKNLSTIITQMLTLTSNKEEKQVYGQMASVVVDKHNNALVIYANQQDISKIMTMVNKLDIPTPQILIKAQIVEANSDTARDLGIQWGGLYKNESGGKNYWITPGASSTGITGQTLDQGLNPSSGMAASFPADLSSGVGLTIGYITEKLGGHLLSAQLSALQSEGKIHILSSPSITTLDNQTAKIESGKDVPFQTVEDQEVQIEWKKAVLSLEVTPHVIDGKILKMRIKTHKDELDFTNTVEGNPTIVTKSAETNIILFNGETTVIGGLSKEKKSSGETGIPWLKDLPGLSWLFKGTNRQREMEEVLIFITPYILKEKVIGARYDDRAANMISTE